MVDLDASGVNESERIVAALCRDSFLRIWSHANTHKDDGKEFCDVVAIFEHHIFIFFVRQKKLEDLSQFSDPLVHWRRWYKETVVKQIRTAKGAERYLRSGRPIFLDVKKTRQLPINFDHTKTKIHKFVVAHGAGAACRKWSSQNLRGSLAVTYTDNPIELDGLPFAVHIDRTDPVHLLDDDNLQIILKELDTVSDLTEFFDNKVESIRKLQLLSYGGEEDLLANYLLNYNEKSKKHFIGPIKNKTTGLFIDQGGWIDILTRPEYFLTKKENESSYFWDKLIDRTCENWLAGDLLSDSNIDMRFQPSAIIEMAKEPRFMRRALVQSMHEAINNFPSDKVNKISRHMRFMSTLDSKKGYVFLQFWVPEHMRESDDRYRKLRVDILTVACGMARVNTPTLEKVVGIAIEPPKLTERGGEDFIYLDCSKWAESDSKHFIEMNEAFGFFFNPNKMEWNVKEFIGSDDQKPKNVGRNSLCPCGSGKKYKRCGYLKACYRS